jgi:hypothetical protein
MMEWKSTVLSQEELQKKQEEYIRQALLMAKRSKSLYAEEEIDIQDEEETTEEIIDLKDIIEENQTESIENDYEEPILINTEEISEEVNLPSDDDLVLLNFEEEEATRYVNEESVADTQKKAASNYSRPNTTQHRHQNPNQRYGSRYVNPSRPNTQQQPSKNSSQSQNIQSTQADDKKK